MDTAERRALMREDLELIDALVSVGAISRPAGRELAVSCTPRRVATRIMELGLCNLAGGGYVIVERLAAYERTAAEAESLALFGSDEPGGPTMGGRLRDEYDKPETD